MTSERGLARRRRPIRLAWALSLVVLAAQCDPPAAFANEDEILRTRVLSAIQSGQRVLLSRQNGQGSWSAGNYMGHDVGVTGLVTLAMLSTGLTLEHPQVRKAVDWLRSNDVEPKGTYDITMAILALTASGDPTVKGKVARLANMLEQFQVRGDGGGAWDYSGGQGQWDNSNAQFAVLGLREAALSGAPVSRETWRRAQDHFIRNQIGGVDNPSGAGWSYRGDGAAYGSMTVAGLSSLSITAAMLQDDRDVSPDGQIDCCGGGVSEVDQSLDAGVRWLSRHFRVTSNPGHSGWVLYYLYGLERAGRFTGRRFFGDHDWYREGAKYLTDVQSPREHVWAGSLESDETVGTSLALLFLSKGLSPVVVNKLKYGARDPQTGDVAGRDWNRHTRDIAHLVDYTSTLEKWPSLLSWQIVDLRVAADGEGVSALLQSPVQYMSGAERPDAIQGRELDLLREYLVQGGFLFATQSCDGVGFEEGFRDLVRRLFDGQYELRKLPATHDVYRSEFLFPVDVEPPELWGVDVGCRTAIIYAPFDHGCRWAKWSKQDPPGRQVAVKTQIDRSLKVGVNVIAYATGRELHDKLDRAQPLAASDLNQLTRGRLTIARVRHSGGWDTAPNALRRLQAALDTVGIDAVAETPNLAASDPALFDYPMLYMHGRRSFVLTEDERAKLRTYLTNGGFMFADACCGSAQFDASFRQFVQETFGQPLERIPITDEVYHMQLGYDIRRVKRRMPSSSPRASSLAVEESTGEPVLEGIQINGRHAIIYSKYDLSCALERQSTSACAGYPTEDAVRIGVNLVLYGLFR